MPCLREPKNGSPRRAGRRLVSAVARWPLFAAGLAACLLVGCAERSPAPQPRVAPSTAVAPSIAARDTSPVPVEPSSAPPQPTSPSRQDEPTALPPEWRPSYSLERRLPPDELRSRVLQSLEGRVAPATPKLLILPFVDGASTVHPAGPGLCLLTSYAVEEISASSFAYAPEVVQALCQANSCWTPGAPLEREHIDRIARHAGADEYVLVSLGDIPDDALGTRVTVAVHDRESGAERARLQRDYRPPQLAQIPAWVVLGLCDHLGIKLSPDQTEAVQRDRDLSNADVLQLSELTGSESSPNEADWESWLAHNPTCLTAWAGYLHATSRPDRALARFALVDRPFSAAGARRAAARGLVRINRPEDALVLLTTPPGPAVVEGAFLAELTRCSLQLSDESLTTDLLRTWRQLAPGYQGCVARGDMLARRAAVEESDESDAASDGPAASPAAARWDAARQEWESAVKLAPQDAPAHERLLEVATPLRLAPEFVDEHFRAAAAGGPASVAACRAKLDWLAGRFDEAPADFASFAGECLDSDRWREGVPQLVPVAIRHALTDRRSRATRHARFKSDELWNLIVRYYAAMRTERPASVLEADAIQDYLRWGALGGRHRELAADLNEIRAYLRRASHDGALANSRIESVYLLDLAEAHTGWGNYRELAAAQVAMAAGDVDAVERGVRRVHPDPAASSQMTASHLAHARNLSRQAAFARRLRTERRVHLSSAELGELLSGVDDELTWRSVPFNTHQRDDDKLTLMISRFSSGSEEFLLLAGLESATVSGVLEWSPGVTSVDVFAHVCAPRDVLRVSYSTENRTVRLIRNGELRRETAMRPGAQEFRWSFGTHQDIMQPCADVQWTAAAVDHAPSGVAIRFYATPETGPHTLSISKLTVELHP